MTNPRILTLVSLWLVINTALNAQQSQEPEVMSSDVIIYGATAGGIFSGISISQAGAAIRYC